MRIAPFISTLRAVAVIALSLAYFAIASTAGRSEHIVIAKKVAMHAMGLVNLTLQPTTSLGVLNQGLEFKMPGIYAESVVAEMVAHETFRDGTSIQFVRDNVGHANSLPSATEVDLPISVVSAYNGITSRPQPAAVGVVGFINLGVESLGEWGKYFLHGRYVTVWSVS